MSAILKEFVHAEKCITCQMNKTPKIERNVSKLDNNSCAYNRFGLGFVKKGVLVFTACILLRPTFNFIQGLPLITTSISFKFELVNN
jgi:hypothetical protein